MLHQFFRRLSFWDVLIPGSLIHVQFFISPLPISNSKYSSSLHPQSPHDCAQLSPMRSTFVSHLLARLIATLSLFWRIQRQPTSIVLPLPSKTLNLWDWLSSQTCSDRFERKQSKENEIDTKNAGRLVHMNIWWIHSESIREDEAIISSREQEEIGGRIEHTYVH